MPRPHAYIIPLLFPTDPDAANNVPISTPPTLKLVVPNAVPPLSTL